MWTQRKKQNTKFDFVDGLVAHPPNKDHAPPSQDLCECVLVRVGHGDTFLAIGIPPNLTSLRFIRSGGHGHGRARNEKSFLQRFYKGARSHKLSRLGM